MSGAISNGFWLPIWEGHTLALTDENGRHVADLASDGKGGLVTSSPIQGPRVLGETLYVTRDGDKVCEVDMRWGMTNPRAGDCIAITPPPVMDA